MTFPKNWKAIEDKFDSQHGGESTVVSSSSLLGFHLADVMVIYNWIDYANGIEILSGPAKPRSFSFETDL